MFSFERLRSLCKEQGTTVTHLCRVFDINPSYFTVAERQGTEIPQHRIERLAQLLHTTPEYLCGESDIAHPSADIDEMIDAAKSRPEIRALFSLSKDATKEDIEKTIEIIKVLRGIK